MEALAKAHRQIKARTTMELMIAAQGDERAIKEQMRCLAKIVSE